MDAEASTGRGGGGGRGRRDVPAVLHNAGKAGHAGGPGAGVVLELLRADPSVLEGAGETGLAVLESQLELDASTGVEVLACDRDGTPVLVIICPEDEGAVLGRVARVVGAFRRAAGLLRVAFAERGLDVARPPRLLLLAPRFSDELPAQLDLLGDVQVAALEYRVVRPRGEAELLDVALLHRSGERAGGERAGALARAARAPESRPVPRPVSRTEPDELTALELEPLSPDDLDGLMDRAYQSIVSLSEQVSATDEDESIRFLVDGRPLATLLRDEDSGSLTLTLDEEGGVVERLTIADELGLHTALNALFERYFRELDVSL